MHSPMDDLTFMRSDEVTYTYKRTEVLNPMAIVISKSKSTWEYTVYLHKGERSIMIKDYHGQQHVTVEVFNGRELIGEAVLRAKIVKTLGEAKDFLEEVFTRPIEIAQVD